MKTYFSYSFFLLVMLVLLSCQTKEPGQTVQTRIAEDLENKISTEVLLGASLNNKPKKFFQADKDHSSISFRSRHWEIVDLIGWFDDFQVVMYSDSSDFTDAIIFAEAKIKSIKMPNPKMQGSLQHKPYIDTDSYPTAIFESNSFIKTGDVTYLLNGNMQLNGVNKACQFDVIFNGYAYPGEQSICGFNVTGVINRKDYNFGGDDELHSGKKMHDDLIEIQMSLRME